MLLVIQELRSGVYVFLWTYERAQSIEWERIGRNFAKLEQLGQSSSLVSKVSYR
mgnify:CR=1 FL=1